MGITKISNKNPNPIFKGCTTKKTFICGITLAIIPAPICRRKNDTIIGEAILIANTKIPAEYFISKLKTDSLIV